MALHTSLCYLFCVKGKSWAVSRVVDSTCSTPLGVLLVKGSGLFGKLVVSFQNFPSGYQVWRGPEGGRGPKEKGSLLNGSIAFPITCPISTIFQNRS